VILDVRTEDECNDGIIANAKYWYS
jgi:hypothetical protein